MSKKDKQEAVSPETENTQAATPTPDAATPEAQAAPAGPEARIQELEEALRAKDDQYLRVCAEYDNFRKRSQKERESIYESSENRVFQQFFSVLDNLERAAEAQGADEGVKMIHTQMRDIMKKHGIEAVGFPGEDFDPNLHNAVRHEGEGDHSVIDQVLDRGYRRGERLLKPAIVLTKSVD